MRPSAKFALSMPVWVEMTPYRLLLTPLMFTGHRSARPSGSAGECWDWCWPVASGSPWQEATPNG